MLTIINIFLGKYEVRSLAEADLEEALDVSSQFYLRYKYFKYLKNIFAMGARVCAKISNAMRKILKMEMDYGMT